MVGGKAKKKRSFIQTAKKFGRLGQRGRGTNIAQVREAAKKRFFS